jgi:hypothetical protein
MIPKVLGARHVVQTTFGERIASSLLGQRVHGLLEVFHAAQFTGQFLDLRHCRDRIRCPVQLSDRRQLRLSSYNTPLHFHHRSRVG